MYNIDKFNNMTPQERAAELRKLEKRAVLNIGLFVATKVALAVGIHYAAKKYWSK